MAHRHKVFETVVDGVAVKENEENKVREDQRREQRKIQRHIQQISQMEPPSLIVTLDPEESSSDEE